MEIDLEDSKELALIKTDDKLFTFRPLLLDISTEVGRLDLAEILQFKGVELIDLSEQLFREWYKLFHPQTKFTEQELVEASDSIATEEDFVYVFYPWKNAVVKLLNEEKFRFVRTNRNKLKITEEEQNQLLNKTIAVAGLSVGNSVAVTIAMESGAGNIKLADFDFLELSNLNRIRSSIFDINLPKVIIAARQIAEIDPFIKVEIFQDGVNDDNIEAFLESTDLLVEVCDSIEVKVSLRLKARSLKIPVIMDTNDRGMVDIERYDLHPDSKMFYGKVEESVLSNIHKLAQEDKMKVLMQLMDAQNLSDKLKLSMGEIGKTISTWPQLASSVMLGGGVTAELSRKILLNEDVPHGRYYVDIEDIIA